MAEVLFVNPDSSIAAYQDLAKTYSAIEPPTWALLLAEAVRKNGHDPEILDCDAERLTLDQSLARIDNSSAKLVVFVLYGQNPNSGTTSMIGAVKLATAAKNAGITTPVCFCGSHTQALPGEVLALDCVDFVLLNEGVYALNNLLSSNLCSDLQSIKGIGHKVDGKVVMNQPEIVVPQDRLDEDMPGYAWDLLPYKSVPLDLYRSHFWHAGFDHKKRTPFAAIYTSLGCQFACNFCMINILNRVDNGIWVDASHSRGMRYWSPEWVKREMKKLADLGVKTLRISDEMFFLNRKYYNPILENCVREDFGFNMWTYSRVDSVRPKALELFKKAGVNWLALGVEAGNQIVRQEVSKGSFKEVNIREICDEITKSGIYTINNYIFGFPEDNYETMQQTLDLAIELNSEMANMYPCQALPGSPLYNEAKVNGWELPDRYEEFAFLSYECKPLQTKHLSAEQVVSFRDKAWNTYFSNPVYLDLVEQKFGVIERRNVEEMAKIKLKRKILGD
ncbi:MAG: B12-binding domain-containing radical SAM protein [Flavobacteriaceae bacterium]|nr:B12-binding domain-containing radical SAM protein [Flavobacteriaceae bacterium]|tara:strand:- start:698 stop:2212 length:1515 start_codon:yes stop_codon:yes gene_type:complete